MSLELKSLCFAARRQGSGRHTAMDGLDGYLLCYPCFASEGSIDLHPRDRLTSIEWKISRVVHQLDLQAVKITASVRGGFVFS